MLRGESLPSISSVTGRNTLSFSFSFLSMPSLYENVLPLMVIVSSSLLIFAASTICEASASFGAPMVKGNTACSGKADACATSDIGASRVSSVWNKREFFAP